MFDVRNGFEAGGHKKELSKIHDFQTSVPPRYFPGSRCAIVCFIISKIEPTMSTPTPATATGQMEAITEPSRFDILCGHDKACYDNDGNGLYRSVIEKFSRQYAEALTRHDKTSVSFEVYSCLKRSTCRFLKYNESIRGWEEMSSVAARDKICRALRFVSYDWW